MKKLLYLKKRLLILLIINAVFVSQLFGTAPANFTIGNMTVAPGEMKSGYLEVREAKDPATVIPITVINGAKKGKVLALVAGVHAYEYPPILALYRLKKMIDPGKLSGTLVLVHIANLPAFQKRIIYYNPFDWKNLNRVFPGSPAGTQSQRIAHVLTEEVVKKCDCLVDMHCGDGNEALIPYCYWMLSGNRDFDEITKKMVLAFGIKYIIIDKARTKDLKLSKYLGNTAVLHGKPAITTESGYLGRTGEEAVIRNIHGVYNVMRFLGMIKGKPEFVAEPIWIDHYEVVYADADGLFYPTTDMGYYVSKGEKVGYITDYFGNVTRELRAPFTGIMLYIVHTPPAVKGEPLFEVGRIKE